MTAIAPRPPAPAPAPHGRAAGGWAHGQRLAAVALVAAAVLLALLPEAAAGTDVTVTRVIPGNDVVLLNLTWDASGGLPERFSIYPCYLGASSDGKVRGDATLSRFCFRTISGVQHKRGHLTVQLQDLAVGQYRFQPSEPGVSFTVGPVVNIVNTPNDCTRLPCTQSLVQYLRRGTPPISADAVVFGQSGTNANSVLLSSASSLTLLDPANVETVAGASSASAAGGTSTSNSGTSAGGTASTGTTGGTTAAGSTGGASTAGGTSTGAAGGAPTSNTTPAAPAPPASDSTMVVIVACVVTGGVAIAVLAAAIVAWKVVGAHRRGAERRRVSSSALAPTDSEVGLSSGLASAPSGLASAPSGLRPPSSTAIKASSPTTTPGSLPHANSLYASVPRMASNLASAPSAGPLAETSICMRCNQRGGGCATEADAIDATCPLCRAPLAINRRFWPVSRVGGGEFGTAFVSIDLHSPSRKQCVVKKFTFFEKNGNEEHIEKAAELFLEEGRVLENLDHPCVPKLLGSFRWQGDLYNVMNFVPGRDLQRIMKDRSGPFHESEILRLLDDMTDALSYVHAQRILHRDVKPSNIIAGDDGDYYLVDFGLSTTSRPDWEQATMIGTYAYSDPEQRRGYPTPSSDLYSLAATCVELLTRARPTYEYFCDWTPPARLPISSHLASVLSRMLRRDPAQRFESAAAVREVLFAGRPPRPHRGLGRTLSHASSACAGRPTPLAPALAAIHEDGGGRADPGAAVAPAPAPAPAPGPSSSYPEPPDLLATYVLPPGRVPTGLSTAVVAR
eukprot:tig00021038_g17554.t1